MQHVDLEALASWMDGQGLGTGALEEPTLLAGGTQNILMRFNRAGRTYILRRPPPVLRANSNETMQREARVLGALAGTNVPHPGLIAACSDDSVLGASFYLMEPVDGFNAATGLPELHRNSPDIRARMGLSMVEAIAKLGAVDYKAVGLEGFGKTDNYLQRQVGRWKAQLDSYAEMPGWTGEAALPDVGKVAGWLAANVPSEFRPGIIHGDYHFGNVMFRPDSGELAAIVDWELSTIGEPLLDLGWLIATWPEGDVPKSTDVAVEPWDNFAKPAELAAHYAAVSGRDLQNLDWFIVLACYKLGIILEGTHARACAGKAPRDVGDRLHNHTIDLFERALRRIA